MAREPDSAYTDGDDAAELVGAYGYDLDPWQRRVLSSWLGRDAADRFTATSCGLSVPRQNGKNALLEVRELYGIVTMGERILHTAHEVKTARKAFLRLASFFENERQYPELAALVKCIRKTNGQEAIELTEEAGGGSVEFSARSRGAARGFTVDVVVFDEAQELTDEQLDALLPTLAAAPSGNRQYIYTGTPPGPSSPGEVFRRTRQTAMDGKDAHLAWHEWSVDGIPEPGAPADELLRLAYTTNPAMGYRIEAGFVAKEALSMSLDGFARERLGWWSGQTLAAAVPRAEWDACATPDPPKDGAVCYAVKFAPDGSHGSLAVCLTPDEGAPHVELVAVRDMSHGVGWFADWLEPRQAGASLTVIDGAGNAQALVDELRRRRVPPRKLAKPRYADVADACAGLLNAVRERKMTHFAQSTLDEAAHASTKRRIGSGGGWGFDGEGATAMEAAALALWAAARKGKPVKRQRIGF